jgi:hypothetical protein
MYKILLNFVVTFTHRNRQNYASKFNLLALLDAQYITSSQCLQMIAVTDHLNKTAFSPPSTLPPKTPQFFASTMRSVYFVKEIQN